MAALSAPEVCTQCRGAFAGGEEVCELRMPFRSDTALLHRRCVAEYEEEHAERCEQCALPMPKRVTTLTMPLHVGDVVAAAPDARAGGPLRAGDPRSTGVIVELDGDRVRVRGASEDAAPFWYRADEIARHEARLHQDCVAEYRRAHEACAGACAHCAEPLGCGGVTELLLKGAGAPVRVHKQCERWYTQEHGPLCAQCGVGFRPSGSPRFFPMLQMLEVRLANAGEAAFVHQRCRPAYEVAHAPPCAQCSTKIVGTVVTVSSPAGKAILHPRCVDDYKESFHRDTCTRVEF